MKGKGFSGFAEGKQTMVSLPEAVFTELVPQIDDLRELQVTLLILCRLAQRQARVAPWVTRDELLNDPVVRQVAAAGSTDLDGLLAQAVARGTLLTVSWKRGDDVVEQRYLANSPKGRMAVAALQRGIDPAQTEAPQRPNIYALYEQNIGPLTALLSEDLQEAEQTYAQEWIEEAFREAVRMNKRNWKYIQAILENRRTKGRDEIHRGDREEDGRKYVEGDYADFIKH